LAAYHASEWSDLFVATAGASAALAGLVFVAVSINLARVVQFSDLPDRALATVLFLVSVLLVSIIGLIPGQSNLALGIELLGERWRRWPTLEGRARGVLMSGSRYRRCRSRRSQFEDARAR